ncbi:hypothetical protein K439DRAFT_1341567 [Ramaria rubella]|nr:hypothetical protein K439DRAFT_1341567 [Ramaria rubella]
MAQYFAAIHGCCWHDVQQIFPETVVRWDKVRITNNGDKICSAVAVSAAQAITSRDASFVRVCVNYSLNYASTNH